jgi:hypothetical protein
MIVSRFGLNLKIIARTKMGRPSREVIAATNYI